MAELLQDARAHALILHGHKMASSLRLLGLKSPWANSALPSITCCNTYVVNSPVRYVIYTSNVAGKRNAQESEMRTLPSPHHFQLSITMSQPPNLELLSVENRVILAIQAIESNSSLT